jgi:hypothetical protein
VTRSDDDVGGRGLPRGNCDGTSDVFEREEWTGHSPPCTCGSELVKRNLAEKFAHDHTGFPRCEHCDVDVPLPARCDVEQVAIAAGQAARPREKRQ